MRLDLADLRLFIAIVDTGSITGGAANAHLALASASERLRKMEAEIGVPLLHRHARGVTMTEAGEVLARHARPLLAQQQRLRQAMHAFACGQAGDAAPVRQHLGDVGFSAGEARRLDGSAPGGADRNRRTHQRGYRQLYPRRAWRRPEWCPMRSTPGRCASIPSLTTRWC